MTDEQKHIENPGGGRTKTDHALIIEETTQTILRLSTKAMLSAAMEIEGRNKRREMMCTFASAIEALTEKVQLHLELLQLDQQEELEKEVDGK